MGSNERSVEEEIREEFVDCPVCGSTGTLRIAYRALSVPHEGDAILLSLKCSACGYRATDLIFLKEEEEKLLRKEVRSPEDLNYLVYLTPGATVRVPELGLELELKETDKGFVTTIEGLVDRFRESAEFLCQSAEEGECSSVLKAIERALQGEIPFTLFVEDPSGRSRIVKFLDLST